MSAAFDPRREPRNESEKEASLEGESLSLGDFFRGEKILRTSRLYDPTSTEIFQISRSKLDLFIDCERCFYLDRRLGVGRPDSPPFTLNNAVDGAMKREFDQHRAAGTPHPLMTRHGIDAVPFNHPDIDEWRDSLRRGVSTLVAGTRLRLAGGVDDVWINPRGELHIVDYKATATQKPISLDDPWKAAYKRQVEVYQWIFKERGFAVSPTSFFVFVNGDAAAPRFDGRLEFREVIIPHVGDTSWVQDAVERAAACLDSAALPEPNLGCEHCRYRAGAQQFE